ncbi:hypothetical protein DACRYDRAFT_19780 [Dacryopinax primogenitus]|uniref:Uncharacterized protein n=1 Tax=Dacryopinax primogenitus (strain DJM 731) TaxID=1858805 RepID=M5G910_DACPD|nr:uncharacterized protein DACRYDRAFT_19780 [Dacryopinax primogenitus]EJU05204.1 hypothetical protein DACRYDRAFT_19780 [Dacryopinax primogenitus]
MDRIRSPKAAKFRSLLRIAVSEIRRNDWMKRSGMCGRSGPDNVMEKVFHVGRSYRCF